MTHFLIFFSFGKTQIVYGCKTKPNNWGLFQIVRKVNCCIPVVSVAGVFLLSSCLKVFLSSFICYTPVQLITSVLISQTSWIGVGAMTVCSCRNKKNRLLINVDLEAATETISPLLLRRLGPQNHGCGDTGCHWDSGRLERSARWEALWGQMAHPSTQQ